MSITGNSGNWVGQSTNTIGSGPVALGAIIEGYISFNNIPDGLVWYTIVEFNNREAGLGTLANGLLTRTNIYATLNAGTYSESGIPLPLLGNAEVYCTLNATAFQEITAGLIKLDGIEDGATGDQTPEEIKIAYESNDDTNAYTDAEKVKLAGIEDDATGDMTDLEIKTAYENNADTNEFDDAEKAKLATVETGATADQDAYQVPYDNSGSGLTATQVQAGIDILAAQLNAIGRLTVKQDSTTGSAYVPKGTTAERTDPVIPGLFRFNTETNEFEGHNDTEWGGIGGGGVPAFIYKSASFTIETKKAFIIEMGDDVIKTATVPDGLPNGSWFAISSLNWTNNSGSHYFVSTDAEQWNIVGLATDASTRNIRISQNGTFYFQKINGKWSVVDGIGEGDASLPVTELQEQIDDNATAIGDNALLAQEALDRANDTPSRNPVYYNYTTARENNAVSSARTRLAILGVPRNVVNEGVTSLKANFNVSGSTTGAAIDVTFYLTLYRDSVAQVERTFIKTSADLSLGMDISVSGQFMLDTFDQTGNWEWELAAQSSSVDFAVANSSFEVSRLDH